MVSTNSWNYDKMSGQELQTLVDSNSNALQLARSGLEKECRVAIKFTETYMDADNPAGHFNELAGLKRLAQAFAAEGKLAEMENHPNDAAKSYLDVIHLGNESARGGPLIDELVGIAIESIGTSHLTNLVDRLDSKSCRETAAILEALDSQRQTWDEVMRQEHDWSRRAFPGLRNEIARLEEVKSLETAFRQTEKKIQERQRQTHQLIIALAARAYELDKGKPPASLADLMPDYLKAVPQDPFTGTNMVHLPR